MKLADLHKKRIVAALGASKKASSSVSRARVLKRIEAATEQFQQGMNAQSAARYKDVELRGRVLHLSVNKYASRGAPPKKALRAYVVALMTIYEEETGRQIGCNNKHERLGKYRETQKQKPHPFLLACLRPAGVGLYPSGIFRTSLKKLHPKVRARDK
jgi:hypothetical protein